MSKNEPLNLEVFDNPEFGILSPLILFVFGCGVYTVIAQQWNQVLLLGIIELLCISALFGSVLMETVFDWFYSILKGFVQS